MITETIVNKEYADKVANSIKDFRDTFECQRCGKCCEEGVGIALWEHEFKRLKKIEPKIYKHILMINNWYTLKLPCVFYDSRRKKCKIYKQRPIACSLFPLGILPDGSTRISQNCRAAKEIT